LRLTQLIVTARLIHRYLPQVLSFFADRIMNAVSEGLNSKIETIKKMAYGFRNREHFRTVIHFCEDSTSTLLPTEFPDEPPQEARCHRRRL
jgi:hypothetical protein